MQLTSRRVFDENHNAKHDRSASALDRKAPWFQIKQDPVAAATSAYVRQSVRVVDNLKTLMAPVLPHTAQRLHEYLGYKGLLFGTQQVVEHQEEARLCVMRSHNEPTYDQSGALGTWAPSALPAGHPPEMRNQALREPTALFKKLDERTIEQEYARLEG